jgi:hypothetical protein
MPSNEGGRLSVLAKIKTLLGVKPKEPPFISVVLHFRKPAALPTETIHAAIRRAWGRDVREDLKEFVSKPPFCFVKFEGILLLLSNARKPYCPPEMVEQALAEFSEVRQREVVREHKGFLAIDLHPRKTPEKQRRWNATAAYAGWRLSSWTTTAWAFTFLKSDTCGPMMLTSSPR